MTLKTGKKAKSRKYRDPVPPCRDTHPPGDIKIMVPRKNGTGLKTVKVIKGKDALKRSWEDNKLGKPTWGQSQSQDYLGKV